MTREPPVWGSDDPEARIVVRLTPPGAAALVLYLAPAPVSIHS
jgi:hypothetical protein